MKWNSLPILFKFKYGTPIFILKLKTNFNLLAILTNEGYRRIVKATHLFISHGVVPPEEPCGDIVGNDDIYSIVFMSNQDTNDASSTHQPAD